LLLANLEVTVVDIINKRISKYTKLDANAEAVLFGQEERTRIAL
jgi:hypothetical protein